MFRLRDLKNGLFQIHSKRHNPAYEGTPKSIFMMAIRMGVDNHQLVHAVNLLHTGGYDYADFNERGQFVQVRKN